MAFDTFFKLGLRKGPKKTTEISHFEELGKINRRTRKGE